MQLISGEVILLNYVEVLFLDRILNGHRLKKIKPYAI